MFHIARTQVQKKSDAFDLFFAEALTGAGKFSRSSVNESSTLAGVLGLSDGVLGVDPPAALLTDEAIAARLEAGVDDGVRLDDDGVLGAGE